jgi:hypothetical protein
VTERERLLVRAVSDRLRGIGGALLAEGWHAEIVVLDPSEIERLPGYKVALVVPIDAVPK